MINNLSIDEFESYLRMRQCAENTIKSYSHTVQEFYKEYPSLTQENMLLFKTSLIANRKATTVNQKICALNAFSKYAKTGFDPIKQIKVQQKSFSNNIITDDDYDKLKVGLRRDKPTLYFAIRFMACTGMRISEALSLTIDDVYKGTKDIVSKGGKSRTIYIPTKLTDEAMAWFKENGRDDGMVFLNASGTPISSSGIRQLLKHYGKKYGIEESKLHPHAFRHYFAIKFLEVRPDIPMLSDILGHDSIETTRIYLRKSMNEQMRIINAIVLW